MKNPIQTEIYVVVKVNLKALKTLRPNAELSENLDFHFILGLLHLCIFLTMITSLD